MPLFNTPGGWMRFNTDRVLGVTALLVGVGSLFIRLVPAGEWINMLGAEGNGQQMADTLLEVFGVSSGSVVPKPL